MSDIKPGDHEYFHPNFHSSLNMGIHFIAKEHGMDALKEHLQLYTKHVYAKTITLGNVALIGTPDSPSMPPASRSRNCPVGIW